MAQRFDSIENVLVHFEIEEKQVEKEKRTATAATALTTFVHLILQVWRFFHAQNHTYKYLHIKQCLINTKFNSNRMIEPPMQKRTMKQKIDIIAVAEAVVEAN